MFLFFTSSRLVPGLSQSFIQAVSGAFSPRVKRPEREADHSPPISAEDNYPWIYTTTPPYAFMA
jgi:hypothetical protein